MNLNPKNVEAKILAVLQGPSDSITCYLDIDGETANVSLNFERDFARILGYPRSWTFWDEALEGNFEGDLVGKTYEDAETDSSLENFMDEIMEAPVYISRKTEIKILSQLKSGLKKQFSGEFKDILNENENEKEEVLKKMDLVIRNLNFKGVEFI